MKMGRTIKEVLSYTVIIARVLVKAYILVWSKEYVDTI